MSEPVLTENGAISLSTTSDPLLDFFFQSVRGLDLDKLMRTSYEFDKDYTIANILFTRAIRNFEGEKIGKGERDLFYSMMKVLHNVDHIAFFNIIESGIIEQIGCFRDYIKIAELFSDNPSVLERIAEVLSEQIEEDWLSSDQVSLCAKWLPSESKLKPYTKPIYRLLRDKIDSKIEINGIYSSAKKYRKILSGLRNYLNIVETNLCSNTLWRIKYSSVPSLAFRKYSKVFAKKDESRFNKFMNEVKSGRSKICTSGSGCLDFFNCCRESNEGLELQFHEFLKTLEDVPRFKVVADLSDSMNGTPLSVAVMFSIISCFLFHQTDEDGSKYGTWFSFSEVCDENKTPVYDSNGNPYTLKEIYDGMDKSGWQMNTNIQSALDKVMNSPEIPEVLLIVSDMQFDKCAENSTNWGLIKEKYPEHPRIVFWNVRNNDDFPVKSSDNNVVLVSGYSETLFKTVLLGKTPSEYVREVLSDFLVEFEEEEKEEIIPWYRRILSWIY